MAKMKLSEIKVNNKYLRLDTDVELLAKSIEQVGLIHPLSVNEKKELIAGGRRYSAIKNLGWDEVEVTLVDRTDLEQELISIDENLVRKPLDKLQFEKSLNRGREIYEQLNPEVPKVSLDTKKLTTAEKTEKKEIEEADKTSYAAVSSEKLGLSKSVIKSAIKRDALSSKKVKEARSAGELSAGQVNELIRMSKEEQDKVLPHIKKHSIKEVRMLVDNASRTSVDEAIEIDKQQPKLPKEYTQVLNLGKRLNKSLSKILLEQIDYQGPESKKIAKETKKLVEQLQDFMSLQGVEHETNSIEEDSSVDAHMNKVASSNSQTEAQAHH
jgi:ParB family chromosome partitioning protein